MTQPTLDPLFAFKFAMQQIRTSMWEDWNNGHVLKTDMVKRTLDRHSF